MGHAEVSTEELTKDVEAYMAHGGNKSAAEFFLYRAA